MWVKSRNFMRIKRYEKGGRGSQQMAELFGKVQGVFIVILKEVVRC